MKTRIICLLLLLIASAGVGALQNVAREAEFDRIFAFAGAEQEAKGLTLVAICETLSEAVEMAQVGDFVVISPNLTGLSFRVKRGQNKNPTGSAYNAWKITQGGGTGAIYGNTFYETWALKP